MTPELLFGVLGALFVAVFLMGFLPTPPDPIKLLRQRFIELSRLERGDAEATLDERVEALSRRFPGRTLRWYLQWLVTDLERAKR